MIVTANLHDFPVSVLERFNVEAQGPDQFVLDLVDLAPARVATVVQQQAAALRNPTRTVDDLLEELGKRGIPERRPRFDRRSTADPSSDERPDEPAVPNEVVIAPPVSARMPGENSRTGRSAR